MKTTRIFSETETHMIEKEALRQRPNWHELSKVHMKDCTPAELETYFITHISVPWSQEEELSLISQYIDGALENDFVFWDESFTKVQVLYRLKSLRRIGKLTLVDEVDRLKNMRIPLNTPMIKQQVDNIYYSLQKQVTEIPQVNLANFTTNYLEIKAAGILLYTYKNKQLYFLMRQQLDESMKGFADLGGKIQDKEADYEIAARECAEESNGQLNKDQMIEHLLAEGQRIFAQNSKYMLFLLRCKENVDINKIGTFEETCQKKHEVKWIPEDQLGQHKIHIRMPPFKIIKQQIESGQKYREIVSYINRFKIDAIVKSSQEKDYAALRELLVGISEMQGQ